VGVDQPIETLVDDLEGRAGVVAAK
jgi:hypothetical protein